LKGSLLCLLAAFYAIASAEPQAKSPTRAFETASIKLNNSEDMASTAQQSPGGLYKGTNVSLKFLVQQAFKLQSFEIVGGPSWQDSFHYDVLAKAEAGTNPNSDQIMEMLQTLLVDRFKLQFHREPREATVLVLVAGKNPKLTPAADPNGFPGGRTFRGTMAVTGYSMDRLARTLSNSLGRIVLNKTGIEGLFDINLQWTLEAPASNQVNPPANQVVTANAPSGPTIFTALQEQLGLRLESEKGMAQFFFIDRAEKPNENQ